MGNLKQVTEQLLRNENGDVVATSLTCISLVLEKTTSVQKKGESPVELSQPTPTSMQL